MTNYIIRRLVIAFITLMLSVIGVGLLIHIVPGDPVMVMLGKNGGSATPEQIENMRRVLGLDKPVWLQTLNYVKGVLSGDMGQSMFTDQPVGKTLFNVLPATLALAFSAMVVAVGVGLPLGFFAAYKHNTWVDNILMLVAVLGVSIPQFWLGLILLLFFSLTLGWLPVAGDDYRSLILPAITLGVTFSAIVARMTRSSMIEVFSEDFMRTARAKGLTQRQTLWRHVLRNTMIPVVTVMGLQFANLLAGTIVVESVFALPGIGRLILQSISNRDVIVVRDIVTLLVGMVVVINFVIDILYAVIDPRLRAKDV